MRSQPLHSFDVTPRGTATARLDLYIWPQQLEGAQSLLVEGRKVKIYTDNSGNHPIEEEWRTRGVTIQGFPMGDGAETQHVKYRFFAGKR